jgi:hypothetical protein
MHTPPKISSSLYRREDFVDDHLRKKERVEHIAAAGEEQQTIFDLSADGASVIYDRYIDEKTVVMFKVNDLPVKAKVVYCNDRTDGFRVGLQFWNNDQETRSKINTIVDSYSRGVSVLGKITAIVANKGTA